MLIIDKPYTVVCRSIFKYHILFEEDTIICSATTRKAANRMCDLLNGVYSYGFFKGMMEANKNENS